MVEKTPQIHSSMLILSSAYYKPHTLLETRDTAVNKTENICLHEASVLVGGGGDLVGQINE